MSLCKLASLTSFASKFRHLPAANHCLYLAFKQYQFSRRFSSVEEENKSPKYANSQDLQLSDSCVKVATCVTSIVDVYVINCDSVE